MSVDELSKISSSGSDSSPSTNEVSFVDVLLHNPKHCDLIHSSFSSHVVVVSVMHNNKSAFQNAVFAVCMLTI